MRRSAVPLLNNDHAPATKPLAPHDLHALPASRMEPIVDRRSGRLVSGSMGRFPPVRARATLPRPSAAPQSSRATASFRVIYREAHTFLEELAEATLADTRKALLDELTRVPLLIIDDLGMRKLPHTAAEDLLELIMRRYERASTILTSNRPVEDWGKLLGDTAAVTALLDRLLHHAHVLKCGPRSWRTKVQTALRSNDALK